MNVNLGYRNSEKKRKQNETKKKKKTEEREREYMRRKMKDQGISRTRLEN